MDGKTKPPEYGTGRKSNARGILSNISVAATEDLCTIPTVLLRWEGLAEESKH